MLNQLLAKADSEYTCLIHQNQWKTKEDSQIIALTAEIKGPQAMVAKFNHKPFKPKSKVPEVMKKPAPLTPTPKLPDKIMHWKWTPPMRRSHKRTNWEKCNGGVRHATCGISCTWQRNTKPRIHWHSYLVQVSVKWWGIFSKAFVLPFPAHPADCHALYIISCFYVSSLLVPHWSISHADQWHHRA